MSDLNVHSTISSQAGVDVVYQSVDARGMRCPLPALRLAKAVREGLPNAVEFYELWATDPAARLDIPALCVERGWALQEVLQDEFADVYRVRACA